MAVQVQERAVANCSRLGAAAHQLEGLIQSINTTPENEALNAYFSRIAQANQRFTDEGVPGWRTDRGEVYVNLGAPDEVVENTPGTTANRILRWTYIDLRLELFFRDESGFGRLRLLPSSRADYERTLNRVRRQG